jgi:hypothetical protein
VDVSGAVVVVCSVVVVLVCAKANGAISTQANQGLFSSLLGFLLLMPSLALDLEHRVYIHLFLQN